MRNTDDHLRNHGFLRREAAGWSLSPAFDVNPDPGPGRATLATSIDGASDDARIGLALEVAEYFRLDASAARSVVREVADATSRWREVAGAHRIPGHAIGRMSRAFEHAEAEAARAL